LQNDLGDFTSALTEFLYLTDRVQLLYKCSDFYDSGDRFGVVWSDPDLERDVVNSLFSEKDAKLPSVDSP
jgi:dTDP-4-dehydrorhamnose 3,5-epimerase-like enzyme